MATSVVGLEVGGAIVYYGSQLVDTYAIERKKISQTEKNGNK
jgi:hypothetical protein